MTPRQIIARIVLLALLGAIITIAVAWLSAWFIPPYVGTGVPLTWQIAKSQQMWATGRKDAFSVSRETALAIRPGQNLVAPTALVPGQFPSWSNWPADLEAAVYPANTHIVEVRGWPMKAMRSRWVSPGWVSGIALPARKPNPPGINLVEEQRALPIDVVWPGFAINTLFYALLLWPLLAMRRWRRFGRGLCPKCAYDLRGRAPQSQVCPECGAACVPDASSSPPSGVV